MIGLWDPLILPLSTYACTIGVANGYTTFDERPILWKVRDISDARQQLVHTTDSPYDYIGVRSENGPVFMGLNEVGVASGNSVVTTEGGSNTNAAVQHHILRNYNSLDQIRNYWLSEVSGGTCNASGCFPFIDSEGNAVIFEVHRSEWVLEYNSMNTNRQEQGKLGFVVRANEFHQQTDGTDDLSIGGRYASGDFNVSGLVDIDMLSAKTVIQGNDDPNTGFEFVRYGPGRDLASISRSTNQSTMMVHGTAPGEDPALAVMWVILGQSNYGIAIPTWVCVTNIPSWLSSGDMYDRAKSLYTKGDEQATQNSVFPVEAYMFDVVENTLLPHWRAHGAAEVDTMERIEYQMAKDAYSLLDCLDNTQSDNLAPNVDFNAFPDYLTLDFTHTADDTDGSVVAVQWNFGDNQTSFDPSPSHTYTAAGTYLVSCTVTDDDGVSITAWRYYVVPIECDIAGDNKVDLSDFAVLSSNWLKLDCREPLWCDGADLDRSSVVDITDLLLFVRKCLFFDPEN